MANNQNWASGFRRFSAKLHDEPTVTVAHIISVYGGMGSFNDIILYEDGQPNVAWNAELDTVREELYELCRDEAQNALPRVP